MLLNRQETLTERLCLFLEMLYKQNDVVNVVGDQPQPQSVPMGPGQKYCGAMWDALSAFAS